MSRSRNSRRGVRKGRASKYAGRQEWPNVSKEQANFYKLCNKCPAESRGRVLDKLDPRKELREARQRVAARGVAYF